MHFCKAPPVMLIHGWGWEPPHTFYLCGRNAGCALEFCSPSIVGLLQLGRGCPAVLLHLGRVLWLSSGQWNVGRRDVLHIQAWPFKTFSSIRSFLSSPRPAEVQWLGQPFIFKRTSCLVIWKLNISFNKEIFSVLFHWTDGLIPL